MGDFLEGVLAVALALVLSFFITAGLFYIILIALHIFNVYIEFSWIKALAFWVIIGIVKTLISKD